jgi:hypothetical protein
MIYKLAEEGIFSLFKIKSIVIKNVSKAKNSIKKYKINCFEIKR